MSRLLTTAFAGLLLLAACGGDDTAGGDKDTQVPADTVADTFGGNDTATDAGDTNVTPDTTADDTEGDTSSDTAEDAADTLDTGGPDDATGDADDTADDTADATDTTPPLTATGAACTDPSQCASGVCFGSVAKVCIDTCSGDGDCPDDRPTCIPTSDAAVHVCATRNDIAGLPCGDDDGCYAGATCVALADGVSRCVFGCTQGTCDGGYTCQAGVCVPPSGFDCSLFDAATGAVGDCGKTNTFGTCHGEYRCNGAGAGSCDAATPAAEVCDGADNDCNDEIDDNLCDDGNSCTVDGCDPDALGECLHTVQEGAACEDGDTCTTGDTCDSDGRCVGGAACECETAEDCVPGAGQHPDCVTATCDGTPGHCLFAPANAGGACETPSACLGDGICDGNGACTGQVSSCDDGNDCTNDVCSEGVCTHGSAAINLGCSDHNACTTGDKCVSGGLCVGNDTLACDDGNPCTDDSCDPATGCVHTNNAAGCDDGVACTINDVCSDGECHGTTLDCTSMTNQCATGTCTPAGCVAVPKAGSCDDGDPCTLDDTCTAGACKGTPMSCSHLDTPCAEGTCDAGVCVPPTTTCNFLVRAHQVSGAINYTPTTGPHWLQMSFGHAGPVGRSANPTGHFVIFGFHVFRL